MRRSEKKKATMEMVLNNPAYRGFYGFLKHPNSSARADEIGDFELELFEIGGTGIYFNGGLTFWENKR